MPIWQVILRGLEGPARSPPLERAARTGGAGEPRLAPINADS